MTKREEYILNYLESQQHACSTASIGHALNITIYQVRYHLMKLCMKGRAVEIKNGRGVSSLWASSMTKASSYHRSAGDQ
ncbi:FaeA/PapI family transcriptional regulator [Aeromonas sp.]|uniref:FaeA/PapI family transcriptional regulator n=1 Tax=Aeromonas sp. TaxID=647 RepID=UPI003FA5B253